MFGDSTCKKLTSARQRLSKAFLFSLKQLQFSVHKFSPSVKQDTLTQALHRRNVEDDGHHLPVVDMQSVTLPSPGTKCLLYRQPANPLSAPQQTNHTSRRQQYKHLFYCHLVVFFSAFTANGLFLPLTPAMMTHAISRQKYFTSVFLNYLINAETIC